jgi:hypothetical protein
MKICYLNLLLGLLFITPQVHAINKCTTPSGGITYQEAPCTLSEKAASFAVTNVRDAKAPAGDELEKRKTQCQGMVINGVLWKDQDSVKLGDVVRIGPGQSFKPELGTVIRYGVDVNSKNSYGAYTGKRMAFCEFDLSEKIIVNVHVSRD